MNNDNRASMMTWISQLEVKESGSNIARPKNAYVSAVTCAKSEAEALLMFEIGLASLGFKLLDARYTQVYDQIDTTYKQRDELKNLEWDARNSDEPQFGVFHSWYPD